MQKIKILIGWLRTAAEGVVAAMLAAMFFFTLKGMFG